MFFSSTTEYRYHSLWYLALHSGMREGEIIGLTWKDVDLNKGLVHVRRTVTPYGENDPKSTAGKRVIPIDQGTVKVIKKYRRAMQEECLRRGDKWDDEGTIFLSSKGRRLRNDNCRARFTSAVKATGAKEITFHGLRHIYATILLHRGVPPEKVAEILGQANVSTLFNTYAHCLPKDEQAVLDAIRNAFHD